MGQKRYGVIAPYFSAYPNKCHIPGCPFENPVPSRAALEMDGFTLDNFFKLITRKGYSADPNPRPGAPLGGSSGIHRENLMSTVGKMYYYCLQHSDYDTLPSSDGDVPIYKIFQDERNASIGGLRNSFRIIRLNFINCNFKVNTTQSVNGETGLFRIWTIFKHTDTTVPPGIYYRLNFRKEDVYTKMMKTCERLTPLKKLLGDAPLPIIVAGEWHGNDCIITSTRQIFIPK
ncbi:MAG TPA: hypothetical protein DEQ02_06730 [Ruminococcaceae bacterium]|nr:hypothetical protein [Oscillospiraceae bacterium]